MADSERAKREVAERETEDKKAEVSRLEAEFAETIRQRNEADSERAKRELSEKQAALKEAHKRQMADMRMEGRLRAGLAGLGALLTAGIWAFDSELVAIVLRVLSLESRFDALLRTGVRLVGAAVLVSSLVPAVRPLKRTYRMGALTIIMAIAVAGLDLLGPALLARISGYLAIGAPIALAFMIIPERSRGVRQNQT